MFKKRIYYLTMFFLLATTARADVPPDAGYIRVSADLIIETNDDLTDYRFFIDFSGAIHEVEVKSKAQSVIPPIGGGVRYSAGRLLAIPVKSLKDYREKVFPSGETGDAFSQAISQNKIEDVIELGRHQFSSTIKNSERQYWSYPTYRLERNGNSLKLTKAKDFAPKMSLEAEAESRENEASPDLSADRRLSGLGLFGISLLVAALLTVICSVIWFMKKRKSTNAL